MERLWRLGNSVANRCLYLVSRSLRLPRKDRPEFQSDNVTLQQQPHLETYTSSITILTTIIVSLTSDC